MAIAKTKRTTKPRHATVANRADVQYVGAFVAGCVMPLAGGAIGALVSHALWEALTSRYTDQLNVLINSAIFASVILTYLAGFIGLTYIYARITRAKLPFFAVTRALLPTGLLAIASITISLQTYRAAVDNSVVLDLLSIALFGAGYVLGWWATRRYAKL